MKTSIPSDEELFLKCYGTEPEVISLAPGRINLIGEHTDYNMGFVLPAAIDKNIRFLARRRQDDRVSVRAENFHESDAFLLQDLHKSSTKKWVNYVKGVLWILKKEGFTVGGIDALIVGDIPMDSGLSSSAALEVSTLNAFNALFHLSLSKKQIVLLSQRAENDYVGVNCGVMDQFISVFGRKNSALFLDCQTLHAEHVPLLLREYGFKIIVYDTRISRKLLSSGYNDRRMESSNALEILKRSGINSYRSADHDMLEKMRSELGEILYKRARHVITENRRVHEAVKYLKRGDLPQFGELLFQSHISLRDDYEVSCPELDLLYDVGKAFKGCLGARLTGAGFGGSGIALIDSNQTDAFLRALESESKQRHFTSPEFYEMEVGGGATIQ